MFKFYLMNPIFAILFLSNTFIYEDQTIALDDELECDNCIFKNCRFPQNIGGAIFSNVKTSINSCIFSLCLAAKAGSIYCSKQLSFRNSYIKLSEAGTGGAFIISSVNGKMLSFESASIVSCESQHDSCISAPNNEYSKIVFNVFNNSLCSVNDFSLFSFILQEAKFNRMILSKMNCKSCFTFKHNEANLEITNSLFIDLLFSIPFSKQTEHCIFLFLSKSKCETSKTIFHNCDTLNNPFFISHDYLKLVITNCCFDTKVTLFDRGCIEIDNRYGNCRLYEILFISPKVIINEQSFEPQTFDDCTNNKKFPKISFLFPFFILLWGILISFALFVFKNDFIHSINHKKQHE